MPARFPHFPGLTYSVMKAPQWDTALTRTPTGKTIRIARQAMPTWRFTLKFSYLNRFQKYQTVNQVPIAASLVSVSKLIADDFAALAGFINARRGSWDSWLFEDQRDEAVALGQIGVGTGSATAFQIYRQQGEFQENLQNINGAPIAASIWQPNTLVAQNALALPTPDTIRLSQGPIIANYQSSGWPCYYQCVNGGRTGAVEPNWRQIAPLAGMTLTDNSAQWQCMGTPLAVYIEQALPDWASGAKALNQAILPLANNPGGFTFICTTAGSGGTEPSAWPQSLGATVAESGGVVWTNYGVSPAGAVNPLVLQLPATYSLGSTGILTFTAAPANNASIFATFSFWFLCHFLDDVNDFELFMNQFYAMGKLNFESLII
jgi:hypothetical protein